MKAPRTNRALVRALATAVGLTASPALAEVTLAPSADGHFGAWLLAGPLPSHTGPLDVATPVPTLGAAVGERLTWLKWSVTDGGTGAVDLRHAGPKERRFALAGVLSLAEPLDGWFLVAADGGVVVGIDGAPVWTRAVPHARGSGWEPVPVALAAGDHTVTLVLERHGLPWSVEARLLSKRDLEPPRGATLRLPGTTDTDTAQIASHLATIDVLAGLLPQGYQPRVHVEFPRGAPVDPSLRISAVRVSKGNPVGDPADLGALPISPFGTVSFDALIPPMGSLATPAGQAAGSVAFDEVRVKVGAAETSSKVTLSPSVAATLGRALTLEKALEKGDHGELSDPDVVSETLERSAIELGTLADRGDAALETKTQRLTRFIDRVEAGKDPLHDAGVLALARLSELDGEPESLRLHVPRSYQQADEKRRYPLVVVLHGYGGSPESVMNAFLGTESVGPHPGVDGFVLAPDGHGDAFYRGPGETEVMADIDWVLRTYPVDVDRVSITGISMGGTGAAHFAFRYPDRFSTAAALAGYHSYFVRRDVAGKPLREWEWAELTRWSPASFAENGRDLFLFVTQGTRDLPLVHSTSLADRYRMLGYGLKEDYPEIGHDVWRMAWENAELFPFLAGRKRSSDPPRIVFRTDSLRLGKRAWTRVTDLETWGVPAKVDATIAARDRIVVKTSGVAALELSPPLARMKDGVPVTYVVDGQRLAAESPAPVLLRREGGVWGFATSPAAPPRLAKAPGIEGPIRDAFSGPLAFVYGTQDPAQTRATREVAAHFRARWAGSTSFPLLADTSVPADLAKTHSLFLVGSRDSNAVVRELDSELPLGISDGAVRAGASRLTGDGELGFACIFPNPRNPARYVVTLEAVTAAGLFRSMSLPGQLPDFIVFDSALAPAAGQQVLGEAHVLGAGYFDRSWALPQDFSDKIAVPAGRDGAWWTPSWEHRTHAGGASVPPP
ncbi:MAG TPA: alpha/beta hydrolase-fold protein [Polyangiaceae bacterium]